MKKVKVFHSMIFGGILLAGMLLLPSAPVKAAGQGGSVTIDGVRYLLMDLSSGSMGRAELDPDSTLSEVYIRNEVEYLGEYYPVNEFWWDEHDKRMNVFPN